MLKFASARNLIIPKNNVITDNLIIPRDFKVI